jgi:hypothetical protein
LKLAGARFYFPGHEGQRTPGFPARQLFCNRSDGKDGVAARRPFANGQEVMTSLISKRFHGLPGGPATRPRDERHAPVRCRTDRGEIPK